jgi:cytochrome c
MISRSLLVTLVPALIIVGFAAGKDNTDQKLNQGKAVFDKSCSMCHSYGPPPKIAPPMVGLSQHYHENFKDTDTEKAVAHMVAFIKNPSKEKSMLLPIGLEKWGLMPAMNLPDEDLRAVAYWVWQVYPIERQKGATNKQ